MARNKFLWIIPVISFFLVLFLDRLTKGWAFSFLQGRPSQEVFSLFGIDVFFTFAINEGAAFGVMSNYPEILILLRIIFIFSLGIYLAIMDLSMVLRLSLFLIAAGALSNIIDSLRYGFVIDMIHIRFWGYNYPIFNIADIAISCGSFLFLIFSSLSSVQNEKS